MSRNYQLPEGKRIHMYRSGDMFYKGAPMVVNPLQEKSLDHFLGTVTTKVNADWGAVRSIHTPNHGTVIDSLDKLSRHGQYVAAGPKGFVSIPGGYENIGKAGVIKRKDIANHKPFHRGGLKNEVLNITVFKNGEADAAFPFKLSKIDFGNWDQALYRLSEKVRLPGGPVKRIYHVSGKILKSPKDITNNGKYVVAASNEPFKEANYSDVDVVDNEERVPNQGSKTYRRPERGKRNSGASITQYSKNRSQMVVRRRVKSNKNKELGEGDEEEEREEGESENGQEYDTTNKLEADESRNGEHEESNTYSGEGSTTPRTRKSPTVTSSKLQSSRSYGRRTPSASSRRNTSHSNPVHRPTSRSSPGINRLEELPLNGGEDSNESNNRPDDEEDPAASRNHLVPYNLPNQIPSAEDLSDVDYLKIYSQANTPQDSPAVSPGNSRASSPLTIRDYRNQAGSLYTYEPIAEEVEEEELSSVPTSALEPRSSLSFYDSGHVSLLSDEDRPDSVFRAKTKSRPVTQTREVDYDTDDGGIYRAKVHTDYSKSASEILDTSVTKIEMPVDLTEAHEVQEEVAVI